MVARWYGRFSTPVKTFLNCTMPAFVNIKVGSLRGTSGEDGTISWPFAAKKLRKVDLISLTPLIAIQSKKSGNSAALLLDKRTSPVQKLCRNIMGLLHGS